VKAAIQELTEEYTAALHEYLEGGGEAALLRAYQVGRGALGEGLGVLEVAALHQEALLAVLLAMLAPKESAQTARRASEFFGETLAPFEMTQRGFQEANAILRDMNRELEERVRTVLRAYRATKDELDEQKRLEQLKNEFISVVSHELRTPLTSIHGALGLINTGAMGEVGPEARQLLDVASRNSQRLVRLVDDILDLQKIETGAMPFQLQPLEIGAVLEQAIEANQAYANRLGVAFVLRGSPRGARVQADADRLVQVLTNLLSNAAKYSPPGETVTVSASRRGKWIQVAVTDRGPGIPEEFRDRIFQKFAQADPSRGGEKGGTGLGLSITKAIVERLGGSIVYESDPATGTTFTFQLPECRDDEQQGAMP
jgi:signal transduction histidine kinase